MASLFLSVRLPKQPYTRLTLDNIDLNGKNIADLKNDMEQLLKYPQNELGIIGVIYRLILDGITNTRNFSELIYCGMVLHNGNQTLQDCGIRPLTTIQVYQRRHEIEFNSNEPTTEQIQKAVSCYRTILKEMTNGTITVSKSRFVCALRCNEIHYFIIPIEISSSRNYSQGCRSISRVLQQFRCIRNTT